MKSSNKILLLLLSALMAGSLSAKGIGDDKSRALSFPVEDVVLQPSWVQQRESLNIAWIKSLDADRLLHNFRVNAGLSSSAEPLGGWEAPYIGLRGHFVGHYLSAASSVVRKYGDSFLHDRLDYMVAELAKCQSALGDGYLSAFPATVLNTSSMVPAENLHFSCSGVSSAAILPSTIIETLSQYSASSI